MYDDNGIQIARKKRKKGQDDKGSEKKAKKAPRKKREARMRPKKVHLASEIAIRRAQWSVGARAPTVVTKPPPQQAEPVEDDSIPRWKRALLAAAPPPAPARRPASKREDEEDDSGKQKRSTLANKRAKAPRPSALELLGAIRAPTESLGNAPKAAVATRRTTRATPRPRRARDRAREVEAAMLRAGRGVAPPPAPPPAPAPARKGAEIDDFHVDEFEAGRRRAPSSKSDLPTYQRPNASKPLPPGWTAKWSARKQMYYYTHKAKGLTRWTPPREEKSPRAKKPAPAPPSNDDALKRARATLAALEGSLPDSAPPVPADALAAAAAASRWDAPPPDARRRGAAVRRPAAPLRRAGRFCASAAGAGVAPAAARAAARGVVRELAVPSQHVGLVVGKGGANLDRMRRLYGGVDTRLGQADEPGAAPPQRRVAFTGMPPDVDRAMADVAGLMRQRGAAATPVHAGAPPLEVRTRASPPRCGRRPPSPRRRPRRPRPRRG